MKLEDREQLRIHVEKLVFAIQKKLRAEYKEELTYLAKLFYRKPEYYLDDRRGKHWQAKKLLEAIEIKSRSTKDVKILKPVEAAKLLGLTTRQLSYKCSINGNKFSLTRDNPEIGCDDVFEVRRITYRLPADI